tara:strand:- start:8249 stop:9880 length:1632 start_codon:yes stop_codon:yes gene_type:complete
MELSTARLNEKWSKKYKKSIDCNNPKGFSQKAHCAGRKKKENVMSSKLEELVGKRLTEEQFDEAAGKKDACYYKVKARYDVWPSAYASGALVKCRKVGAKNWGNSKKEGVNEASMELNKLKDAIKMFQKKIEKQGRVTNARDEEHLSNLIKLYKQMGGKGVKEGVNEQSWHKDFKGYSDKELKVISKFIMLNDKGIDGVIKMSKKKDFKPLIKKMAQKGLHEGLDDLKALPKDLKKSIKKNREENVNEARDPIIDKMDRKTKITFSKSLSPRLNHLKGKTLTVVKKGINLFNVLPDGAKYNPANVRTIEAPVLLRMMKNRAITKIIDGKGKVLHNVKEGVIKENPAAIAAAQRMVVQNKSGNKISVNTARQSSYAQKDPSTHKKAKSMFQRIKDKFKKKESVDEARGTCWVGYQQKGMKEKNGRMVPNCVKEIYEIYYEENGEGHGYTFEHIKENDLNEAEYQGRKVKLGKIMQGDVKKFKVYVKNPKGNVVKVNFGQGGGAKGGTMRIRKSNPKARANFRARHNCDNPGPRHKARYWSCRKW